MGSWEFFIAVFFRPHYGPEVDSASKRNEYQGYLLGGKGGWSTRDISWGKGGRCLELTTLPPSGANSLAILGVSTSWNPKGLSRPVIGWLDLHLFPTAPVRLLKCRKLNSLRETYNNSCPPRNMTQMLLGKILALINIHTICLEFNCIKSIIATDYSIVSNELKDMNAVDSRNTYEQ